MFNRTRGSLQKEERHRYAETSALPAQWFTAYTRSPRSAGLLASVARRVACKLDPSIGGSGPHDFAVR